MGNFVRADDGFRKQNRTDVSHGFDDQMTLTEQGLVLGAGALLAKMVAADFASMARKSASLRCSP